jgi:hypothetical protein
MRTLLATIVLAIAVSHAHTTAQSASASVRKEKTKVLVHVTSGMSSNARGISENDLKGKSAEFATPSVLLRLAKEHDGMFTS